MRFRILLTVLALFIASLQGPAQTQSQGLRLRDIRIGLDKQTALVGLRLNYQLEQVPVNSGVDGYLVTNKSSKDEVNGQINFSNGTVASVSEQIGGPYLDRNTINMVRDLHRLLAPYGRKTADGRIKISFEVEFAGPAVAGFGDVGQISFKVEPGRQVHLNFIAPDASYFSSQK